MTKPLIRLLLPHPKHRTSMVFSDHTNNSSMFSDSSTPKSITVPLLGAPQGSDGDLPNHEVVRPGSLRALLTTPTHTVHYYWRKFDDAIMRPVFGGRGFVPYVPGSPTEQIVHDDES
ncbi:hypothetical protein CRG98_011494 [Punica granatum]|nr:hypothetical protein CRG98_011494 [Punica granatum]